MILLNSIQLKTNNLLSKQEFFDHLSYLKLVKTPNINRAISIIFKKYNTFFKYTFYIKDFIIIQKSLKL